MHTNQYIADQIHSKFEEIFQSEFHLDHCFESESHRRCRETGSVITHGFTNASGHDTPLCTITHGVKLADHPKLALVRRSLIDGLLDIVLNDTPTDKNQFLSSFHAVPVGSFIKRLLEQFDRFHDVFEFFAGVHSCPASYSDVLSIIVLNKAGKQDRLSVQFTISSKNFKVVNFRDLFIKTE